MESERSNHACEVIQFDHKTLIFVFGGTFLNIALDTIDTFDIDDIQGTWKSFFILLPAKFGIMSGSIVPDFGPTSCDAIFVAQDKLEVVVCNGGYIWTRRSVAGFLADSGTNIFTMDAAFFGPLKI